MSMASSSAHADDSHTAFSGLAAEYGNYDALGLAQLIVRKNITALELLSAVRQRVDALNPKLNGLCHLFFGKAEAQINEGLAKGPFWSVPFAVKDLSQYLSGTIRQSNLEKQRR